MTIKNLGDKTVAVSNGGKVFPVLPGDVFPEWATVTNPNVLGDQKPQIPKSAKKRDTELEKALALVKSRGIAVVTDPAPAAVEDEANSTGAPPRAGRGASVEAWAAHAEAHGVELPQGANRDEIIAAVQEAGAPA